MRGIRDFAAQQAESVAEAQREQFATLTLSTAVELTGAALRRMEVAGTGDAQARLLRPLDRATLVAALVGGRAPGGAGACSSTSHWLRSPGCCWATTSPGSTGTCSGRATWPGCSRGTCSPAGRSRSGVKPARYRGRFHWVTIVEVPRFPASYLTELVGWSYQKAFSSLSKAKQIAITKWAG